ncbi:MAG: phospho-sugar mutase, partial [Actinobacteria bacterium]|nr:phospho-sugar mutase [Actinomycetota bacterium]
MSAYVDAARGWLAQDPDAVTRDELTALLERVEAGDAAAANDLADRFSTRLAFGTAGLRGTLGAGSNRMNRVLVAQAAAGFAAYLLERGTSRLPASDAGALGAGDGEGRDAAGSEDRDATGSEPDDRPVVPGSDHDDRPVVVVGYDGRRNSDVFARDSVEIFTGAGLRAILLPRMLPTPVLAFAVRHLG